MNSIDQKNPPYNNERRKHPRTDVQLWIAEKDNNSHNYHLLSNLSTGGVFIEQKHPLQCGSVIDLELDLTGRILFLKGKIIDNYKNSKGNFSGAGVEFIGMDEDSKSHIAGYLQNIEEQIF